MQKREHLFNLDERAIYEIPMDLAKGTDVIGGENSGAEGALSNAVCLNLTCPNILCGPIINNAC